MARRVPFSLRSTPPPPLKAGVASPPRCTGREKLPARHPCGVSAALGDAFPIRTTSPGKNLLGGSVSSWSLLGSMIFYFLKGYKYNDQSSYLYEKCIQSLKSSRI